MSATGGLRKRRTHLFVQVPSDTIRDKRISFRSRGLLAYLLDMPDGWDVKSEFLASQGKEGREAIRTALHELGKYGYYRLERRQMLTGTFNMGTAVSEEPVADWAEAYAEYDGKAVPCYEQKDGSFKVRRKDGTLTADGFESAVDPNRGPDDDGGAAGSTEDGFPGPGFPDSGSPDAGEPDSGSPVALSKKETKDTQESTSMSETADAAADSGSDAPVEPIEEKNDREDVTLLCERLADWIVQNGSKRPTITKRWRDDARLLLDTDKRPLDKALALIDWCQQDSFERTVVLSMPKFRDRYDSLRLKGIAQWEAQQAQTKALTPRRGDIDWDQAAAAADQMDQQLGLNQDSLRAVGLGETQ